MRAARTSTVILAAACLLAVPATANAGTTTNLDPTFAAGVVREDFGAEEAVADLAVYPDGRVVVAILEKTGDDPGRLFVARYTAGGRLDPTFGPGLEGFVEIPTSNGEGDFDGRAAIAIQDDGKVVVAARASYPADCTCWRVVRLTAGGVLDADPTTGFSGDGIFETNVQSSSVRDMAIQENGRIVIVGSVSVGKVDHFAVMRLTTAGALDTTFDGDAGNGNGLVAVAVDTESSYGRAVAIAPTGEIVVAGETTGVTGQPKVGVIRLRASNGTLDTTFSTDGIRFRTVGVAESDARDVAVLPDGRILTGGSAYDADGQLMAFLQFRADGTNDPTFGTNGLSLLRIGTTDGAAEALELIGAGRIVAVADAFQSGAGETIGVVRLSANGTPDPTFDVDGSLRVVFGHRADFATSMGLGVGGRIVIGGGTSLGQDLSESMVARLLADGAVDQAFGLAGTAAMPFHFDQQADDSARGVAIAANGKIVAAGIADDDGDRAFGISRLTAAGHPDLAFGLRGRQTVDFTIRDDHANDVAIGAGGVVVAAGCGACDLATSDFVVVRLLSNGTLDPAFGDEGDEGTVFTSFGSNLHEVANGVAIQSNGRIVVAGTVAGDFGVARYLTDGSLDPTFSGDGLVRTDLAAGGSIDDARGLLIQPDGRIVVVGSRQVGDLIRFAVVRYLANGALDTSFSTDGKLTTAVGLNNSGAWRVAIDSQARLVVVGSAFIGTNSSVRLALARYLPNGAPDNSFSGDGQLTDLFGEAAAFGRGVAVQPNDRVVVTGTTIDTTGGIFRQLVIARYTVGGVPDTTFGSNGHDTAFPRSVVTDSQGFDVALQPGVGLVVAGDIEVGNGTSTAFAFARFDP